MAAESDSWQVWVDTGGTFTDCLALDPVGVLHRAKVLSSAMLRSRLAADATGTHLLLTSDLPLAGGPLSGLFAEAVAGGGAVGVTGYDPVSRCLSLARPLPIPLPEGSDVALTTGEEAPILAARLATNTAPGHALPPMTMRLATTRGTNALLERRGVPVALFTTRGFGDLLRIKDQQRPDLFALAVDLPLPLHAAVIEVDERLDASGRVVRPLRLDGLEAAVAGLQERGIEAGAIALVHSYRNPTHEEQLAGFLRDCGMTHVSRSADLAPLIKIVPRAQTAVADAYLDPVIGRYLRQVRRHLSGGPLHVMTSAGGLVRDEAYRAKDSLLSGPAGGVAGAAVAGKRAGCQRVISFDMGGTSTDVARYDGDFEYQYEHRVGDVQLAAPALAIETVAAGGGSICRYRDGRLQVGPQSAGADPGPACYGAGGPLTVTDANLLLGRLDPGRFGIPLSEAAALGRLEELVTSMGEEGDDLTRSESVLAGFVELANERMAGAIRRISLQKGFDPSDYALVAFGGAGAQHACGVAERLGMDRILVPEDASLLSALGLGSAAVERLAARQVLTPLDEVEGAIDAWLDELAREATAAVLAEGQDPEIVSVRRRLVNLRFAGQESTISIDRDPAVPLREAFLQAYHRSYGHRPSGRAIEVESIRAVAAALPPDGGTAPAPVVLHDAVAPDRRRVWIGDGWVQVAVCERGDLRAGAQLAGPALIFEAHSATLVAPRWQLQVGPTGELDLRRRSESSRSPAGLESRAAAPEAVRLALFTHALGSVASDMGSVLQRTALSTNVKERLDFSCAVLDPAGRLVVNAPHIPVHLGALGLCVRAVKQVLDLGPGDTAVTNHPAYGGSHLPDITLVTPVHADSGRLLGYVASRAHHAEIGGARPGSMPPDASRLADEGVVIPPTLLARAEAVDWEGIREALLDGRWPTRSPADNLADLEAALAANHRGRSQLRELARTHGEETVIQYMDALRSHAARGMRRALAELGDGTYRAREELDDGSPIVVEIRLSGGRARLDFAGTAGVHPGNLNATPAIVTSAVIYVLRLLVDEPLPLNEGLLEAVDIHLPPGLLNPPFAESTAGGTATPGSGDPAVVGGNVETSQRLVDTLIKALGLAACSQGTMNNTLFGTESYGYYETLCGGCGATPGQDGASAVHSHMTNTRITDAEVIEHRYPVRLERFAVRGGSGGAGLFRGGDGVVRVTTFLEPMSLSVLTQHRRRRPYGLAGGHSGAPGRQILRRADGTEVELGPVDGCDVGPGDQLIMETPGGGGFGPSGQRGTEPRSGA